MRVPAGHGRAVEKVKTRETGRQWCSLACDFGAGCKPAQANPDNQQTVCSNFCSVTLDLLNQDFHIKSAAYPGSQMLLQN